MQTKEQALVKLNKSKFRSSFYLTKAERAYIAEKGMDKVHRHAIDLVRKKIAPAILLTTVSRHLCMDIQFLKQCMLQPFAVEVVWKSGIMSRKGKS